MKIKERVYDTLGNLLSSAGLALLETIFWCDNHPSLLAFLAGFAAGILAAWLFS